MKKKLLDLEARKVVKERVRGKEGKLN